ncbi:MAG: peroxidase [Nitrospinaceae bacterium]|nr:peroxidase [Nitrospinaceae bacterium]MBT3433747.1 peroxidase [Nitrospinaceae bacterium]MBT3822611.1 peroxidase [Nitrospinaceae bacterium]MBT4092680.1 peroxidase [Nitrospinaceae bacterium]MBT4432190.1 peroxidase [Nitrospinaceae bacterium]
MELKERPDEAQLTDRMRIMLDFARRLTKDSETLRRADMDKLRAQGLDDTAIVDLVALVGYFNFINRVAHGLGVYLDEGLKGRAAPEALRAELERLDE